MIEKDKLYETHYITHTIIMYYYYYYYIVTLDMQPMHQCLVLFSTLNFKL